jgi:Sec7-like guanine-nucleotide exchange factor
MQPRHVLQVLADPDAAYVLAYSIIMLNTDRHNTQVGCQSGL